MNRMLSAVVEKPVDAQKIIDDLVGRCMCDRADIGVMAGAGAAAMPQPETFSRVAAGAGKAASAGMDAAATLLGGLFGAASEVVSKPVPGVGFLSAAGHLAQALSKSALTGIDGLSKGLAELGVAQDMARRHAEALQRGAILLVIHARTENQASCARKVLETYGALEPAEPAAR